MEPERRDPIVQPKLEANPQGEEPEAKAKSYVISKQLVFDAYLRVKANRGAPGVDGVTIEAFERNLKDNLYKIWNRMSSGTYFPPPVMAAEIPKSGGKTRLLGIPTVGDRIAQTVAKMVLEPLVEPKFHADSYGYRPKKSAHDALAQARARCWQMDWVIDMDIRAFFDSIDHELMMKAVRVHCTEPWVLLYVQRWLRAPLQVGTERTDRTKGTPQGGVISPLLANIFLHHAFDEWMRRIEPKTLFERYADDVLIHCWSQKEAEELLVKVQERLRECGLELHSDKTKIVYCKDDSRTRNSTHVQLDFLGFTFRGRTTKGKTSLFVGFNPAISARASKEIRRQIRGWHIGRQTEKTLEQIAAFCNAKVRGWIQYYGRFMPQKLKPSLYQIERDLRDWAWRKYKRLRRSTRQVVQWLAQRAVQQPQLFEHWKLGLHSRTIAR